MIPLYRRTREIIAKAPAIYFLTAPADHSARMRRELVCSLSGRAAKSPSPRVCRLTGRAKLFLSIKLRDAGSFERTLMIKFFFALATAAWALLSITTMAATAEKPAVVAG